MSNMKGTKCRWPATVPMYVSEFLEEKLQKARHTNLRINFSKHQKASASSFSRTIIGEHKSLIPVWSINDNTPVSLFGLWMSFLCMSDVANLGSNQHLCQSMHTQLEYPIIWKDFLCSHRIPWCDQCVGRQALYWYSKVNTKDREKRIRKQRKRNKVKAYQFDAMSASTR